MNRLVTVFRHTCPGFEMDSFNITINPSHMLHFVCLCLPMLVVAQSPAKVLSSARLLDSILQDHAFKAFGQHPRTGIFYNGDVPCNLTGIEVSAARLRSGSFKKRGIGRYKEFHIPMGVVVQPFAERLVLVYHNLANWSSSYYPLPGYIYLAPVVGFLAYDGSNLSATNVLELDVRASSDKPILLEFSNVRLAPANGASPTCVHLSPHGSVEFFKLLRQNVCSANKQGHFSIVVAISSPSPTAAVAAETPPLGDGFEVTYKKFTAVGFVVGVFVLMLLLALMVLSVRKCRNRERIRKMEEASQVSSALSVTSIKGMKMPMADMIRTRAALENHEYLP